MSTNSSTDPDSSFQILCDLDKGGRRIIEVIRGITIGELKTKHGWENIYVGGVPLLDDVKVDFLEDYDTSGLRVTVME